MGIDRDYRATDRREDEDDGAASSGFIPKPGSRTRSTHRERERERVVLDTTIVARRMEAVSVCRYL